MTRIPLLNAEVTSLRFYQRGETDTPRDKRQYKDGFDKTRARYIAWELNLAGPASGKRIPFTIKWVYYGPDSTVFGEGEMETRREADWSECWYNSSWGWKEPGNWSPGRYRVDVFIADQLVGSNSFEVYEQREASESQFTQHSPSEDFNMRKETEPQPSGLPGEMHELVRNINALIDRYGDSVSATTSRRASVYQEAEKELDNAKKDRDQVIAGLSKVRDEQKSRAQKIRNNVDNADKGALDHLQKQSVDHSSLLSLGTQRFGPRENALDEAERLLKEANTTLRFLNGLKRPQNAKGLFLGFGIVGFLISVIAAANASRGDGTGVFFLVNFIALGLAGGIYALTQRSASSQMRSEYSKWLEQKSRIEGHIGSGVEYADTEYNREVTVLEIKFQQAQDKFNEKIKQANAAYSDSLAQLKAKVSPVIQELKGRSKSLFADAGFAAMNWNLGSWSDWQPATAPSFAACMGSIQSAKVSYPTEHQYLDMNFAVPALVPFATGREGRCLLFKSAGIPKEKAAKGVQSLITRLVATVPPGKVKFTFIDPVGLGQNASSFMQLSDYDDSLVSGKAWTEPSHIEQQLLELTEHMETVIQKYLRNDFDSIEQYNDNAGEIAEAYRVLVVWDFPVNFTETSARRLVSIAENGPRCGVYTIVMMDTSAEKRLPYGFTPADLERASNVVAYDSSNGFVWSSEDFKRHTLALDEPPSPDLSKHIINMVGAIAKTALNVQVPYEKLLSRAKLTDGNWWNKKTENVIEAPLGPHGANKIQSLVLGEKTAHHAIVVGRTGSGKSNLMHVIITSLALSYSPDEIELYLIDFKQGVEFKPYAASRLPHAKVIAIESEREFGISVLEGLDRELHRRGELFRTAKVNNITDYRRGVGQLSRILLLVDEFQEFFSQDDGISSQARIILDRLVRQGRSQGIHVMLGSQTLKGASDLPHSIISQMGVRIALQCTEADARQIMGDDNLVNRQLTRPGEAIYNPESGEVQANKLFQVALFTEQDRETYLGKINQLSTSDGRTFNSPIIFEGNEPAKIEACVPLQQILTTETWPTKVKGADAWLGEPIAIRPPVAARFRRQGGSNLLVVARDEQQGVGTVLAALFSLMSQYAPNLAEFFLVNMTTADSEWNEIPDSLREHFPHDIKAVGRKNLSSVLETLAALAEQRANDETSNYREVFLIFLGLHRIRDLRDDYDGVSSYFKSGDGGSPDPKALFAKVMREGPESGIHVIAWCDAHANVARIDRRLIGEFSMRVAGPMSNDDSQHVIDDSTAAKLDRAHRAIFFDEERPGQLDKFRPYAIPQTDWIRSVGEQLRARNGKAQSASGG